MTFHVSLFAMARDLAGGDRIEVDLPAGATVGDLRAALSRQVPRLEPLLRRSLIAVDHNYAPDSAEIPPGAELACIPPVSGG